MKKNILFLLFAFFTITFFSEQVKAAIPVNDNHTSVSSQNEKIETTTHTKKQELKVQKLSKKINSFIKNEPGKIKNVNGLVSFILGLSSLLIGITAIPAVIFGIISLTKKEEPSWMAIVGLSIGGLFILLILLYIIILAMAL